MYMDLYGFFIPLYFDLHVSGAICIHPQKHKLQRMCNGMLILNLLTTTIVAPPSNASKWQMGFNSAFKGMHEKPTNTPIIHSVY